MSVRVAVLLCLTASAYLPPAAACIGPSDFVERTMADHERWMLDIDVQRKLVVDLARDADAILIGEALNDWQPGHITEFRISYSLKGHYAFNSTRRLVGTPIAPALPCTPVSVSFRNTLTNKGESYLLYVKGNKLLRAANLWRSTAEIALAEELKLIKETSNNSLEPTR